MSAEMIEMYAAEATRPMPDAGESVPARTGETPEPVPQPSVESQPEFTSQEEMIEKIGGDGHGSFDSRERRACGVPCAAQHDRVSPGGLTHSRNAARRLSKLTPADLTSQLAPALEASECSKMRTGSLPHGSVGWLKRISTQPLFLRGRDSKGASGDRVRGLPLSLRQHNITTLPRAEPHFGSSRRQKASL